MSGINDNETKYTSKDKVLWGILGFDPAGLLSWENSRCMSSEVQSLVRVRVTSFSSKCNCMNEMYTNEYTVKPNHEENDSFLTESWRGVGGQSSGTVGHRLRSCEVGVKQQSGTGRGGQNQVSVALRSTLTENRPLKAKHQQFPSHRVPALLAPRR